MVQIAWTVPLTAVANATLTAAQWNASVRDNLLETAVAKASAANQIFVSTGVNAIAARTPTSAFVVTSENTTSTTFAALATAGPAVTLTTGTKAIVIVTTYTQNNTAGATDVMSYAVSGSTTTASDDERAVMFTSEIANSGNQASALFLPSLTAGSNTFTAQYRVTSGTGSFARRWLVVIPL